MKRTWFAVAVLALGLGVAVVLPGCGGDKAGAGAAKSGTAASSPSAEKNAAPLPPGIILTAAPAGAKDILAVKKAVKEGDDVVIRGRVGGDKKVFVGGTMLVMDTSLKSCNLRPDDVCETPWDYCCDSPETKQQNRALIQIVDAKGQPLKAALEGPIEPLDIVVVKGKVARADGANFIINASGIYVEEKFKKG